MSLPAIVKVSNRLHVTLDYLILGKTAYDVYESCDDTEMVGLLEKCSPKELELIKKLIKLSFHIYKGSGRYICSCIYGYGHTPSEIFELIERPNLRPPPKGGDGSDFRNIQGGMV